jgi:hypothetical protein
MSKVGRTALVINALFALLIVIAVAHAQRPAETDASGAAYLRVNINPTDLPPMVNINPYQTVPRVQVTDMPEVRIAATGCSNRRNFQTGIARSIQGPLMITYLHIPEQNTVTLSGPDGNHSMNLGSARQITTAIYLQANQRLEFGTETMYSGCRPE